jgi:hypothetical protein
MEYSTQVRSNITNNTEHTEYKYPYQVFDLSSRGDLDRYSPYLVQTFECLSTCSMFSSAGIL